MPNSIHLTYATNTPLIIIQGVRQLVDLFISNMCWLRIRCCENLINVFNEFIAFLTRPLNIYYLNSSHSTVFMVLLVWQHFILNSTTTPTYWPIYYAKTRFYPFNLFSYSGCLDVFSILPQQCGNGKLRLVCLVDVLCSIRCDFK